MHVPKESSEETDEELARRQREISVFSALAAGGTFTLDKIDAIADTATSLSDDSPSRGASDSKDTAPFFGDSTSNVEDSGTFTIKSQSQSVSEVVTSNLEAARAALTGEEPAKPVAAAFVPPNFSRNPLTFNQPIIAMHSEPVLMPRPLFYGPILSPRVLRETRRLVAEAMKERDIEGNAENPPRLSLLPPQIRNLIGAIDAFGYGLSPFPSGNEPDESDRAYFTGSPYLSSYQPVWGASTRAARDHERKQSRTIRMNTVENREEKQECSSDNEVATKQGELFHQPQESLATENGRTLPSRWTQENEYEGRSVKRSEKEGVNGASAAFCDTEQTASASGDNALSGPTREEVPPTVTKSYAADNDKRGQVKDNNDQFKIVAKPKAPTSEVNSSSQRSTSGGPLPSGLEIVRTDNHVADHDQISKWVSGKESEGKGNTNGPEAISEKALFAQWARGETPDAPLVGTKAGSGEFKVEKKPVNSDTFRNVVPIHDDSDEDSVVGSEMKKKVGVNEHLDAALKSLAQDCASLTGATTTAGESMSAADSQNLLSQLAQTTIGGRPLSNLELTNGCIPLYECDDPSLPTEADLGIYETKEEHIRNIEVKRSQEIIEKYSVPNIFCPISCPSPCSGPDDNHSWNSRSIVAKRSVSAQTVGNAGLLPASETSGGRKNALSSPGRRPLAHDGRAVPSLALRGASGVSTSQSPKSKSKKATKGHSRHQSLANIVRYGWWSIRDDEDDELDDGEGNEGSAKEDGTETKLQLPPMEHGADSLFVNNGLAPSPSTLKDENLALFHMHPATSVANTLPFLSDRPPNWRYVQVDAKAVGFRPVGGEIEPLFCSLAIYHVDTHRSNAASAREAPTPNLQCCGRVTEVLNFDVVTDKDIEARCGAALWPYLEDNKNPPPSERTQGTRCGVFPIPSNLNMANLYAVIIVRKVFSNDSDIDVYMAHSEGSESKGTLSSRPSGGDLEVHRSNAEKACQRQGNVLMPFAFGVAPILQVFGTDVPTVATSRAVGIPLFRLTPGLGDRPIIDHIMVMLYPRADYRSAGILGPAPLTNGGQAMLVMRNYGFLGLHNVVQSTSKIARQRLVDPSGELQLKECQHLENAGAHEQRFVGHSDRNYVVPVWHERFVSEPTVNGGRNVVEVIRRPISVDGHHVDTSDDQVVTHNTISPSFYAQELAPVPLQLNPPSGSPLISPFGTSRGMGFGKIPEHSFHTSFCNELLCTPRLLHNCPKGNVVIKVEFREIEWRDDLDGFLAELPQHGPSMYNPRRGPAFVTDACTSCIPSTSLSYFMDEFKLKLPLTLQRYDPSVNRKLVILFSVYRLKTKVKRSWTERLVLKTGKKLTERLGALKPQDSHEELRVIGEDSDGQKSCLILACCGFAPVTLHGEICSLIGSGLFDVKMSYTASLAPDHVDKTRRALILRRNARLDRPLQRSEIQGPEGLSPNHHHEDFGRNVGERWGEVDDIFDDSLFGSERALSEGPNNPEYSAVDYEGTSAVSEATLDRPSKVTTFKSLDTMILQVRIVVRSSLHPQNATLREFLQRFPDRPAALGASYLRPSSIWRQSREALIKAQEKEVAAVNTYQADDETSRLIVSTIDISKASLCSPSVLSAHWVRASSQLLRISIAGNGVTSLLWANPAALIPLRINAFASFLQLLSRCSVYLMKNAATQLDGKSKWNVTTLGKLVSMIFDESMMFDNPKNHAEEPFNPVDWTVLPDAASLPPRRDESKSVPSTKKGHRKRHTRRNSDNLFLSSDTGGSAEYSAKSIPLLPQVNMVISAMNPNEIQGLAEIDSRLDLQEHLQCEQHDQLTIAGKIDSKSDFQHALMAGAVDYTYTDSGSAFTNGNASGSLSGVVTTNSRRKYMTLPLSALATINEDLDGDEQGDPDSFTKTKHSNFSVDTEMIFSEKNSHIKQMRVPKVSKSIAIPTSIDTETQAEGEVGTLKLNDEDIESAGTAFLDILGQNLGYGSKSKKNLSGEEQRVGQANHRKARSHCSSIDWTLPDVDSMTDSGQTDLSLSTCASNTPTSECVRATPRSDDKKGAGDFSVEMDCTMSALKDEAKNVRALPNYIDRILQSKNAKHPVRWHPFAYEVVIFQWVALLKEQRRTGAKSSDTVEAPNQRCDYPPGADHEGACALIDAAKRTRGVSIACAPVMFEIIKKSLGWRLHNLVRRADSSETNPLQNSCPPLVKLDDSIMSNVEYLVSMITDACIDNRNFDSWEYRQTSIDVNDAIVRFIRDLFAFLDTEFVHRLILVYFSRFGVKEGKHWQDRDSKIGLRCSWEVCKLRLNAVTTFIRFQDFTRVNSPQMMNWGSWPLRASSQETRKFFNDSLKSFLSLEMSRFTNFEGPNDKCTDFPPMKPHWLSEIVVDICLAGTEHAEQFIQHRSASLLHELLWSQSQEGRANGTSSIVASMYVTFIVKVLNHISYLASLGAKSQLRQDILPCVIFVVQCAPLGLLRGLWRKLCKAAEGKGCDEKFGATFTSTAYTETTNKERRQANPSFDEPNHEPDILDMFSLFNLALISLEYEGSEDQVETENGAEDSDQISIWRKEFLPAVEQELHQRQRSSRINSRERPEGGEFKEPKFTSSTSRKWYSHDAAIVIINTCRYIVREMLFMKSMTLHNISAGQSATMNTNLRDSFVDTNLHFDGFLDLYKDRAADELSFSDADTVVFVRAASSVYLHCLVLRQSDIVRVKTLIASVELVKIYGVKDFMHAVGETLQHWMRVVLLHCGARRAQVRVQALEFLALVLRVTWNCYGSFSRVRLPLLAVQTEVMERIVATAATRFYREQRRMGMQIQTLSNDSAESSLSLLWRTLDRLHHQSASQNVAFRSDVIRLAEKTKKLYRAYIAAHALAILNRSRSPLSPSNSMTHDEVERSDVAEMLQSRRISIHRIMLASAGYCKQFLGPQKAASLGATVAHNEAVEDAFLAAADVFSPTELPSHRVAWLQKLAEFHASRSKHAEEATCRFQIHCTYQQAVRMHESIWSSVPFLPWANDSSDGVHLDGEGPAGDPDDYYDADYDFEDQLFDDAGSYEMNLGKQLDKSNSFRRIFYRVANSVRMRTGDWDTGGNKNLFFGVTFASEYGTVTPWISLREMEEYMVEEAELAGDLYLKAGIAESSRYAWGLATQFYSRKFNYAKLGRAYRRLSTVVQSRVPVVDTNEQALELSHPLGRFYRVWFHGGAPDELIGAEFVYRASGSVKLEEFGKLVLEAINCILPDNTPIDLLLDDGRPEESSSGWRPPSRRLGPTSREPVKIKVTPLRPLVRRANTIRGTPEWFHRYTDIAFQSSSPVDGGRGFKRSTGACNFDKDKNPRFGAAHRQRDHSRSSSGIVFSSCGSIPCRVSDIGNTGHKLTDAYRESEERSMTDGGDLVGVDRFTFFQPVNKKTRGRSSRDWLKSTGDFADKSLRVTLLQVERTFPACVARQAVTNRTVFTQSPLEAGVHAVCSWCSVLFRTAVATNGLAVLGKKFDGIGKQASKVVSDCIHASRVKEMGLTLLKTHGSLFEEPDTDLGSMIFQYERLSDEEIVLFQVKLARGIVVFMEILHLLITHNRDLLLAVVDARKRNDSESLHTFANNSLQRESVLNRETGGLEQPAPLRVGSPDRHYRHHQLQHFSSLGNAHNRAYSEASSIPTDEGHYSREAMIHENVNSNFNATVGNNDQTDSAIAIQSELQRAFISMTKALYPQISRVLKNETPRWLKQCTQESYFSSYAYRQTIIPMAEELYFFAQDELPPPEGTTPDDGSEFVCSRVPSVSSAEIGLTGFMQSSESPGGSQADSSIRSHPRYRYDKATSSDGSYRQLV